MRTLTDTASGNGASLDGRLQAQASPDAGATKAHAKTEKPLHGTVNRALSPIRLVDMHCHLDRMANADEVARDAAERGIALFCTTVTPTEARAARECFAGHRHVRVGVGLHPWWIESNGTGESVIVQTANFTGQTVNPTVQMADLATQAAKLAASSRYIGEIGLDFSSAHAHTRTEQLAAFEKIAQTCASHPLPGRIISIHAVRAASDVLDILEQTGLIQQASCIFHWFSGTSDELARARKAGCYFSVNERMLATKRGREYARQIPCDRLLLETDAPAQLDTYCTIDELDDSLNRALASLAQIRDVNVKELATHIAQTSSKLLAL